MIIDRQSQIVKWDDTKHTLKQKYLPCNYEDELFEQLTSLTREYVNR